LLVTPASRLRGLLGAAGEQKENGL